jgi:hypothetical protein
MAAARACRANYIQAPDLPREEHFRLGGGASRKLDSRNGLPELLQHPQDEAAASARRRKGKQPNDHGGRERPGPRRSQRGGRQQIADFFLSAGILAESGLGKALVINGKKTGPVPNSLPSRGAVGWNSLVDEMASDTRTRNSGRRLPSPGSRRLAHPFTDLPTADLW